MGNTSGKKMKKLDKFDLELALEKVYQYLNLNLNRKINELIEKERCLKEKMENNKITDEMVKIEMITIVNLFKYINATKMVMRYTRVLKEKSITIVDAQNSDDYKNVQDLKPYFEGIVWSIDKLNLMVIKEFAALFVDHFGVYNYQQMSKFEKLDHELRNCFSSVEPSHREITDYLKEFLSRYGLDKNKNNDYYPKFDVNNTDDLDNILKDLKDIK
jgi:hypothetical protein